MVLWRPKLREEPDDRVHDRAGLGQGNPDLMQSLGSIRNTVDGFSPPRSNPAADAWVSSQNDLPDWGVGESAQSNGGDGGTKADLRDHARKCLSGKIEMHTDEVCAGVFLTCLFERGPAQMQHLEVCEYPLHWPFSPEDCRLGEKRRGKVGREVGPCNLNRLSHAVPVHLHRQRR